MAGNCSLLPQIEELKEEVSCKIIKDVGHFSYIVTSCIPGTGVSVKFQLTCELIFII